MSERRQVLLLLRRPEDNDDNDHDDSEPLPGLDATDATDVTTLVFDAPEDDELLERIFAADVVLVA